VDVLVAGAGQAGLAVSYYLRAFGVEHLVLERGRVGESWRGARRDSFTLVTPVVWCTGFGPDTGWVHVPVPRADGLPVHRRGITASPGVYVAGYSWLSTRGSGILYGVAADAARIAKHIAATAKGGRAWTRHQPLRTLR
jgi:hypothetical protein